MSRILIIDDERLIRLTLRKILERAGHEVIEAANGSEGIGLHLRQPADLIITDIIMPEKEGIETIKDLRRAQPDLKIIAVSGGGRAGAESYLEIARHFGAEHVFEKPFNPKELLAAIESSLDKTPAAKPDKTVS
jgi:DNA-binding response OmpR family regulator